MKHKFNLNKYVKKADNEYRNINLMLSKNIKDDISTPDKLDSVFTKNINFNLERDRDKIKSQILGAQISDMKDSYPGVVIEKQNQYSRHIPQDKITVPSINMETAKFVKSEEKQYDEARQKGRSSKEDMVVYPPHPHASPKDNFKNIPNDNPTYTNVNKSSLNDILDCKYPKVKWSDDVIKKIQTADALIYHIYAKAGSEGRDLNSKEKSFVYKVECEKENTLKKGMS